MRVVIDPDLCVGSGDCVRIAPEAFQIDEDQGISVPQPGAATADPAELRKAALACPTQAISVQEDD